MQMHDIDFLQPGQRPGKKRRDDGKVFATSLAMEKVVSAPRVIRSCFPISTTSISLVGSLSKSTMLAAPLPLGSRVHGQGDVGLSEREHHWFHRPSSRLASPPPAPCGYRQASFQAWPRPDKSSTPACFAIVAAVRGLSPVIMTVRKPHLPQAREAFAHTQA